MSSFMTSLATPQITLYQGAQGGSGKRIGVIHRSLVYQFSVSFHVISLSLLSDQPGETVLIR